MRRNDPSIALPPAPIGFAERAAGPIAAISALVRHRDLLRQIVGTDLRVRYAGSALGILWSFIHPIVLVSIYLVVFAGLMGARLAGSPGPYEYGVHLCAGFIPWVGFSEIVMRATTVFVDRADLVRQAAFPKIVLPAAVLGVALFNVAILALAFVALLALLGRPISPVIVAWPAFLVLQLLFATGLGLVTSVLHVFLRDTAQALGVLLQFWFWMTPIVYPVSVLPPRVAPLLELNPLVPFTRAHQRLVVEGGLPDVADVAIAVALTGVAIVAGLAMLAVAERRLPDEL